jgi:hypothetical protein
MILDAATLARGWLSVACAASTDKERPQLCRTVCVEQHTHGIRLASTDSYIIFHTWIPEQGFDLDPEPGLDEVPYATAIAIDRYGRAAGLFGHLLRLTKPEEVGGKEQQIDVAVHLGVPWQPEEVGDEQQFEGFAALAVSIEHPDHERVQLEIHEGDFPRWQLIVGRHRKATTNVIATTAGISARLAKAAKVHGDRTVIKHRFGGKDQAIAVQFGETPEVLGMVMPCEP